MWDGPRRPASFAPAAPSDVAAQIGGQGADPSTSRAAAAAMPAKAPLLKSWILPSSSGAGDIDHSSHSRMVTLAYHTLPVPAQVFFAGIVPRKPGDLK